MHGEQSRATGVLLQLWRAAAGFRVVTALLSDYLILRWRDLYADAAVALGVAAGIAVVTAVVSVLAITGRAHRLDLVSADLAVTVSFTLLTRLAQHPAQYHGGMPTLTTAWAAGPVIEAGLLLGGVAGVGTAVVQFGASMVVRDGYDGRTLLNGLLLLLIGAIAGYLATVTVRVEQERADIAAERAQLAERDRLTRAIHDGVLQVLGLVHRKALAAGGDWAAIGVEAARQEAALRALITSQAGQQVTSGRRNLAADLSALRTARVTVSVPESPVFVSAGDAAQLCDAVREALRNVDKHAGDGARAWVFLEELDGRLAVSVRDDGCGFEPQRLHEAVAEGRLGMVKSIRGRVEELGGSVTITSAPGQGTEVEIVVPAGMR